MKLPFQELFTKMQKSIANDLQVVIWRVEPQKLLSTKD